MLRRIGTGIKVYTLKHEEQKNESSFTALREKAEEVLTEFRLSKWNVWTAQRIKD